MGNSIAARAGSSALVYSLNIASATPLNYEYGGNLTASTNAESVIKLYWDKFTAILNGETGRTYVIEASTNFVNWTQINTNTLTSPTAPFTDASALILTRRFYRAVAQ